MAEGPKDHPAVKRYLAVANAGDVDVAMDA